MMIRRFVLVLLSTAVLTACADDRTGPAGGAAAQVRFSNGPFVLTISDLRVPVVEVSDASGSPLEDPEVALTTDDPSVAVIDAAGRIRGVSAGTTTVRASVDGVQGTATVTVTGATTYFDLTSYDLRPVPVAIDSGWTTWDGVDWFVVIRTDSGSLRLHGSSPRRYELRLRVMEYRAVTSGGVRTLVPHLAQNFTDHGQVAHDGRGDLLLQSEVIGGYTNRADVSNSGAVVTFRVPGDDTLIRLDHARRP